MTYKREKKSFSAYDTFENKGKITHLRKCVHNIFTFAFQQDKYGVELKQTSSRGLNSN